MKTALTELIEWSEKDLEIFIEDTDEALRIYEAIKDKATELLEKEKEQIEGAYHLGQMGIIEVVAKEISIPHPDLDDKTDAEKYFNDTYNQ